MIIKNFAVILVCLFLLGPTTLAKAQPPTEQTYSLFSQANQSFRQANTMTAGSDEAEKLYEIVATTFNNWTMPFIRYKTNDYAILTDGACKCGRNFPLIKEVVGRAQEFLVDKDENLISASALTSIFDKLPLLNWQFFEIDTRYVIQIDRKNVFLQWHF